MRVVYDSGTKHREIGEKVLETLFTLLTPILDEVEAELGALRAENESLGVRYESSHASRLHAERCVERLEAELAASNARLAAAERVVARLRSSARNSRQVAADLAEEAGHAGSGVDRGARARFLGEAEGMDDAVAWLSAALALPAPETPAPVPDPL